MVTTQVLISENIIHEKIFKKRHILLRIRN